VLHVGSVVVEFAKVALPVELEEGHIVLMARIIVHIEVPESLKVRTRWRASAFVLPSSASNAAVTGIAHLVNDAPHRSLMCRMRSPRVRWDSVRVIAASLDHAGEDVIELVLHSSHQPRLASDSRSAV
jgi:hypothetical protein